MKDKNYGIDALKILSMFMVVVLHVLTNGGILNASVRFTGQYEAGWFLQTACFCAVDVFALITGYLWVNARYKYRNIIELWLQVFCYSVIISIGMKLLFSSSVSLFDVLKSFFPVMAGQYWYFSSYFALFLFIPLLNTVLEHTEKKQMFFSLKWYPGDGQNYDSSEPSNGATFSVLVTDDGKEEILYTRRN